MSDDLILNQKKEMDGFKQPATLDDALEAKMGPVIGAINQHVEKIYQDFNTALYRQMQGMDKVERDLSKMVQVLWGIVNESNARLAALENVLIKNGMNKEDLEKEIVDIKDQLKSTGEWQDVALNEVMESVVTGPDATEDPKPQ